MTQKLQKLKANMSVILDLTETQLTSDNSLIPWIDNYGTKTRLKFNKNCLKQSNKLTYDYGHKIMFILFMNLVLLVQMIVNPH